MVQGYSMGYEGVVDFVLIFLRTWITDLKSTLYNKLLLTLIFNTLRLRLELGVHKIAQSSKSLKNS